MARLTMSCSTRRTVIWARRPLKSHCYCVVSRSPSGGRPTSFAMSRRQRRLAATPRSNCAHSFETCPARPIPQSEWSKAGEHRCRSEEHTSELQSLMRISYAVFCLKKKKIKNQHRTHALKKKIH